LWLQEKTGREVLIGWEPKQEEQGVWAGAIRKVLRGELQPPADPLEFQRLYLFDRAEDIYFTIAPRLKDGNILLYDRYALSTLAYGMLSNISVDRLITLHDEVIGPAMVWPHLNIILDLDPAIALSRKSQQYDKPDLFEKIESLNGIRNAYRVVAEHPRFKASTIVVDANQSSEKIDVEIKRILELRLAGGIL
jgi:thymidylate kinase